MTRGVATAVSMIRGPQASGVPKWARINHKMLCCAKFFDVFKSSRNSVYIIHKLFQIQCSGSTSNNVETESSVFREVPVPVPKKFPLGLESGKISRTQLQLSEEWKVWRTQLQLSEECGKQTLFKTRNRARKIYQYSRNPADKTTLNRIQNKIKRKIQAVTQKQWEDKLASLDTVDGSLWSTTKGFKKKRSPISALKGNTGIAYTDEEKAETLANSLESQFQLNNISNPTQDNNPIRLVTRFFNNENNFDDSPSITKPSEIVQIINNFKIKKPQAERALLTKCANISIDRSSSN
ncbi:RNA-directed DNA polymerase from mobile element jockey [Trichonephila clavipes]|nr:RNA-directed DNA polymerase from mobile element jockey [Trichonephila clavipes]